MKTNPFVDRLRNAYAWLICGATWLKSPFLLVVRLYWGWQFFGTGTAKLGDVPAFVERFAGWGVPFPHLNVILAGTAETVCGLLLLAGLASRLVALPLIFTMVVAYLTAEKEALQAVFSDSDKFVSATPFQFMFAALIVLIFGPGFFSVDALIGKFFARKASETSPAGAQA